MPGQPEQLRQPADMGIDRDAIVDPEGIPQHHVCRLAAHPGEDPEGLHVGWHFAPVPLHQAGRHPDQIAGLVAEKPGGTDQLLDLTLIGLRQRLRGRVPGKQGWGHHVDPQVGTLGGQDGCHQQFEGGEVVEGAVSIGIG